MYNNLLHFRLLLIGAVIIVWSPIQAADKAYDLENGEEINEVCAGCHGEYGEGGKQGEYPRLAGMPVAFIARQLHLFRDRKRPNMAMIEYVDHRQMPDQDIKDIAQYLAGIKLKTKLPPIDETAPGFDAYARLLESKKLMQIPRAKGDIEKGRKIYKKECDSCHGKEGWGDQKKAVPMVAGQYSDYLVCQFQKFLTKIRIHDPDDPDDELLSEFTEQEITDILAYMSIMDD